MVVKKKVAAVSKAEGLSKHDDMIMKGGKVSADVPKKIVWVTTCVRLPETFVERIEKARAEPFPRSRNAWILDAIEEKLGTLNERKDR